ncbi:exported hypothetical protein [Candidatus Terasakiella magnetica]|uniref:Uncharacterized protein n=1 Tax=Candidatus Terasakiella magnetica TaxID=1867952 RepID=A0A1C3RLH9_9PROT|nr:TrbG/VirB9 family P-type conjugative transfer protein [Candidatus Terasakiella magnetica]SCA58136.1 exported hypothetical protein [Candidatus Terasakiella magnetica]
MAKFNFCVVLLLTLVLSSNAIAQDKYQRGQSAQHSKPKGKKETVVYIEKPFDPMNMTNREIEELLQLEGGADLSDSRAVLNAVCDPKAKGHKKQLSPGIRVYEYHKHKAMHVCIGIGGKTWIEFPSWEIITKVKPVLGSETIFGTVEHDSHSVTLHAENSGVDTTLHVRSGFGNLYTFFVKAIGTEYKAVPDASVFVYVDEPEDLVERTKVAKAEIATEDAFTTMKSEMNKKPDYKREKPFDWTKADCNDYRVAPLNDAGKELMPERVCTDGYWTLFDLGDKSDSKRRVTIYQVVDRTDQPLAPQTRGSRDQLILVNRTGKFTLGIGEAIICATLIDRKDKYKDHPNG